MSLSQNPGVGRAVLWQGQCALGGVVPGRFWWLPASCGLWPHHSRLCFCGHIAFFVCLSDLPLIRIPVVAFGAQADNLRIFHLNPICQELPLPLSDRISFPGSPLGGRFSARGGAVYASGKASGKSGPSGSVMSATAQLSHSSALLSSGFTLRLSGASSFTSHVEEETCLHPTIPCQTPRTF